MDLITLLEGVVEQLPVVKDVVIAVKAVHEHAQTVKRNREEVVELRDRCIFLTANFIEKHSNSSPSTRDVTRLQHCLENVKTVLDRHGGQNNLKVQWRASKNKDEITQLNRSIDSLVGDLNLTSGSQERDDLKAMLEDILVSAEQRCRGSARLEGNRG